MMTPLQAQPAPLVLPRPLALLVLPAPWATTPLVALALLVTPAPSPTDPWVALVAQRQALGPGVVQQRLLHLPAPLPWALPGTRPPHLRRSQCAARPRVSSRSSRLVILPRRCSSR
jgi:hypothetical protein